MARFRSERAAVILAGGDGTRLSAFTREMFGEEIPKQFCRFRSEYTLLEQTWRRGLLDRPCPHDHSADGEPRPIFCATARRYSE